MLFLSWCVGLERMILNIVHVSAHDQVLVHGEIRGYFNSEYLHILNLAFSDLGYGVTENDFEYCNVQVKLENS